MIKVAPFDQYHQFDDDIIMIPCTNKRFSKRFNKYVTCEYPFYVVPDKAKPSTGITKCRSCKAWVLAVYEPDTES